MKQQLAQSILQQVKENYNCCALDFSQTRVFNWPEISELADKYVKKGMKILDVGCGNGRILELLENRGIEYVGVDNSEGLIKEAGKSQDRRGDPLWSPLKIEKQFGELSNNAHRKISPCLRPPAQAGRQANPSLEKRGIRFEVGDILNLPFKDNEFDAALCVAVLHHIPSKELRKKAMSEMARVLRPNGILVMSNWNFWQDKYRKNIYRFAIDKIFYTDIRGCEHRYARIGGLDFGDIMLKPFSGKGNARYHHAFTKWGIKKLFKQTGFKVIDNYYTSGEQKAGWRDGKNLICVGRKINLFF